MGEEYRFCEEFGLREVGVEAEEQYGKIRGILRKSAIRKEYEDFLRHKDEFVCRKYSNIPKNGHVPPWGIYCPSLITGKYITNVYPVHEIHPRKTSRELTVYLFAGEKMREIGRPAYIYRVERKRPEEPWNIFDVMKMVYIPWGKVFYSIGVMLSEGEYPAIDVAEYDDHGRLRLFMSLSGNQFMSERYLYDRKSMPQNVVISEISDSEMLRSSLSDFDEFYSISVNIWDLTDEMDIENSCLLYRKIETNSGLWRQFMEAEENQMPDFPKKGEDAAPVGYKE